MNTKHLACALLATVIFGFFYGAMALKQRWDTAVSATEDAAGRHAMKKKELEITQTALEFARKDTAARRKYLEMWRPKFEQSGTNETTAKNEFSRMLKRFPSLTQFLTSTSAPVENKDMSFVNRRIASSVKLEGGAEKAIQLLASIEREMPTSRISMLEIRKGQRGNDVELDLSVEVPLLASPPPAK